MPSKAIPPANPMTSSTVRLRSGTSDLISHSARTALNRRSVAVMIPATDRLACYSPQAVRKVGAAMFSMVTAMMGTITERTPRKPRPARTRLSRYLAMAGGEATVNEPFPSCLCPVNLQCVDGLGKLAGAPGAAAEPGEDLP